MPRARAHDFRQGHFDKSAEYAFRALAALALAHGDSLRAADLARATGVPPAYLAKVMRRLVRGGVVDGQKGHGGGFRLARAPAAVCFAEVLAIMGSAPDRNRCAFGWGRCNPRSPCPLHPAWSRLSEAFHAWADTATLADVVPLRRVR